ncbi:DNA recombination and repair protein Rad51, C-terminal, partial [Cynara cardunculus var. scolymus]
KLTLLTEFHSYGIDPPLSVDYKIPTSGHCISRSGNADASISHLPLTLFQKGHLPMHIKGLDAALSGGIPFHALTELFCLKISLLTTLPSCYGGLDGRVIHIDVESKFSSRRLIIEIGLNSFPKIFCLEGRQEMAGRITVLRPGSLTEYTESLRKIKVLILQHQVKLLIMDSMAALVSGEYEQVPPRQHPLGWHISLIKSLAEFSRIPVANDRWQSLQCRHLLHSLLKVTSSGILLLNDDGVEKTGPQINAIDHQGLF